MMPEGTEIFFKRRCNLSFSDCNHVFSKVPKTLRIIVNTEFFKLVFTWYFKPLGLRDTLMHILGVCFLHRSKLYPNSCSLLCDTICLGASFTEGPFFLSTCSWCLVPAGHGTQNKLKIREAPFLRETFQNHITALRGLRVCRAKKRGSLLGTGPEPCHHWGDLWVGCHLTAICAAWITAPESPKILSSKLFSLKL